MSVPSLHVVCKEGTEPKVDQLGYVDLLHLVPDDDDEDNGGCSTRIGSVVNVISCPLMLVRMRSPNADFRPSHVLAGRSQMTGGRTDIAMVLPWFALGKH